MRLFGFLRAHPKYKIRHKILEHLYLRLDKRMNQLINPKHKIDLNKSNASYGDVATAIGISEKEMYAYHIGMHYAEHEQVKCTTIEGSFYIGLEEAGVVAYLDNYWLREGQKELNERFYDKTKWIVPVLALLATIGSIFYSATKVQGMQKIVETLQSEVEILRQKNNYQNDSAELPIQAPNSQKEMNVSDSSKTNTSKHN